MGGSPNLLSFLGERTHRGFVVKPGNNAVAAWTSNWTKWTWVFALLKKSFSPESSNSLLKTMSTQSSLAFARIANGDLKPLSARTASSSSLRTYSWPTGSTMFDDRLRVMGRLIEWITNSWVCVPSGHRLQGPFSPGLGGSVPWRIGSRKGAGP